MTEETIPQMRETIERLTKDLKSAAAERDEAVGNVRSLTAKGFATAANFTPAAGELYAKNAEGDLTAEGFADFTSSLGLVAAAVLAEGVVQESPAVVEKSAAKAVGSPDLAAMARGGSTSEGGAGSANEETMTRAEWTELSRTDPAAASEALAKGKVQISKDNPFAPGNSQRPGNPFLRGQK